MKRIPNRKKRSDYYKDHKKEIQKQRESYSVVQTLVRTTNERDRK